MTSVPRVPVALADITTPRKLLDVAVGSWPLSLRLGAYVLAAKGRDPQLLAYVRA
jgi:hypothetical protein